MITYSFFPFFFVFMFETFLLLLLGWSRGGRKKSLSEKGETRQSVESKRERERERERENEEKRREIG